MTGRHSTQSGQGWRIRRAVTFLVLSGLSIAPGVFAAESQNRASRKPVVGELAVSGSVAYRTGIGPWLNPGSGAFPIVLPLEIRGRQGDCRIQIGTLLLEASPGSVLAITGSAPTALDLAVTTGSTIYALGAGTRLAIAAEAGKPLAEAGGGDPELPADSRRYGEPAHAGVIVRGRNSFLELVNLKGRLVLLGEAGETRSIEPGETVQLKPAEPPAQGWTRSGALPRPKRAGALAIPAAFSANIRSSDLWWELSPDPDGALPLARQGELLPQVRSQLSAVQPPPRHQDSKSPLNYPIVPPRHR